VDDGGGLEVVDCGGGAVRAYVSLDDEFSMRPAMPAAADWAFEGRKRSCFWSLYALQTWTTNYTQKNA
jgi:hypothetical protein